MENKKGRNSYGNLSVFSSQSQKKGAMTVPKLVTIILAIVILVFLVFGATQLRPLGDKLGVMFDNVLSFFKLAHYAGVGDCTDLSLADEDGKKFLESINLPEVNYGNTFLSVCDDGTCGVGPISGKEYRIFDGKFESSSDISGLGGAMSPSWNLKEKEMNNILKDGVKTKYFLEDPSFDGVEFDIKLDIFLQSSPVGYILKGGEIDIRGSNTGLDDLENYLYVRGEFKKKEGEGSLWSLGGNGVYYIWKNGIVTQYFLEKDGEKFWIKFDFLSEPVGVISESGKISIGENNVLNDLENYVYVDGKFERKGIVSVEGRGNDKDWFSLDEYLFWRNTRDTKEDWEVYHRVLDLMKSELNENELKRIYQGGVAKTFTLYGDGNGVGEEVYATWEDKQWRVGDIGFAPHIDDGAIDSFVNIVTGSLDDNRAVTVAKWFKGDVNDNVYFREADPLTEDISKENPKKDWQSIDVLVGGDNTKLDKSSEVETLKEKFAKIKERLLKESEISADDFAKLKGAIVGKTIPVGEFTYTLDLEKDGKGRPVVILISGSRKYWVKFSSHIKAQREMGSEPAISLEDYPIVIASNDGNDVFRKEIDYKLPKTEWDKFYRLNLIKDFIRSKCR